MKKPFNWFTIVKKLLFAKQKVIFLAFYSLQKLVFLVKKKKNIKLQ